MVGIIGAMKIEMADIKSRVENPVRETISGIEFIEGTLEGVHVVVATSGIGKVFAGMCAQTMILRYKPDLMINVGVAGSLSPDLNIGDIAVADRVVQHDMDTSGIGDPPGMISGIEVIDLPCHKETAMALAEGAGKLGFKTLIGRIATGDQFVSSSELKKRITDSFPSLACEMEGAGMGQVCYVNEIPFCILRSISDNGDESATGDYGMSLETVADRATKVLIEYLRGLGS